MRCFWIGLLVLVPLLARADEPDPEPPASGMKQLEGEWELNVIRLNGQERKAPAGLVYSMRIRKGKMVTRTKARETTSTIKVDARKKPCHIDTTNETSKATSYGIYKLDKDELQLASGTRTAPDRPKDFASARQVLVFKRKKK
jgi:uncharacterized protein (TIGR03067 family)